MDVATATHRKRKPAKKALRAPLPINFEELSLGREWASFLYLRPEEKAAEMARLRRRSKACRDYARAVACDARSA